MIGQCPGEWFAKENSTFQPARNVVNIAGWSSSVARLVHNQEVVGSNPTPRNFGVIGKFKGLLNKHMTFLLEKYKIL